MENNKEFDDYIKGLFGQDPKVPTELNWEAMDFDLPKPKKKKKRRFFFLLFLGLMSAIVLFGSISLYLPSLENPIKPSSFKIPMVNVQPKEAAQGKNAKEQLLPRIADKTQAPLEESTTNTTTIDLSFTTVLAKKNSTTPTIPSNFQISSDNTTTHNTFEHTSISSRKGMVAEQEIIPFSNFDFLPVLPPNLSAKPQSLDIGLSSISKREESKKVNISEAVIGLGYNSFNTQHTAPNTLSDKVKQAVGRSFRLGLRMPINSKWQINAQLALDIYRSTFDYTRALPRVVNPQTLQAISRTEITHHNNYTHVVGLQLGVNRQLIQSKLIPLYAGANITPSYVHSNIGKTVRSSEVALLSNELLENQFLLSGELTLGLRYPLGRSLNFELAYQFHQPLLNDIFINTGISATQRSSFLILFSYRLGQ